MTKTDELKQELKAMCPNCDGSGTVVKGVEVTRTVCDSETGEPLYQVPDIEYEPEQCEWCYYFDLNLTALIQSAITDHDAAQWKAFPENKPEATGGYICTHQSGMVNEQYWNGEYFTPGSYVIAFRELPKPYQP
jgi:hypothetical protein